MERIIVGTSGWAKEDLKTDPEKLIKISQQIESVVDLYSNQKSPESKELSVLIDNISDALYKWTGSTYIGVKKDIRLESSYTAFFDAFYNMLVCFMGVNEICRKIAQRMLYSGVLYRYLGHPSGAKDYYSRVEPEYNDTWVSWSKEDVRNNHYLRSKLYGTKTLLICKTDYPKGIDLTGWDEWFGTHIVTANESEVVYPTLRGTITEVIYFDVKKR